MNVPLLDLKAQYATMKNEIDTALAACVDSQYFILGPQVKELEEKIADYCGAKYAVGCASGSDAILLALMALGAGPGKAVVTTPFTFFATAGSIWRLGAIPLFVDIDPRTYNMNPDLLKGFLGRCQSRDGKRLSMGRDEICAIMPVHLFGQCADMDAILEIAGKYDIPVVEDAAQAIGSEYKGRRAGGLGALGCFSFFPSKNLGGFGDGGIVTTNDEKLEDLVRVLRTHGGRKKYFHDIVGMNSRLDTLQAAVILAKLPHLDDWNGKRAEHAAFYNDAFADTKVETPFKTDDTNHIYNQYTIRVSDRDGLQAHLKENGVGNAIYYPLSLHQQNCFKDLGYIEGDMPESEKASKEVISLPVYPELTEDMQKYVVDTVLNHAGAG
jgi:dTDP-4-amino-4,6-dideoxygalactose transaminase